ncbi:hypothetical protein MPTK1_7g06180 [Marchantia polymorpha subsp. ruderalis]|uniref:Uncharacterized protein n=2 Tax=Marchantia polymorpha TaxID=3197 RepID=A0AAF6BWP2_MARPO|nr:hypothetical protein MARPO_0057s0053 [Marchantia polymorpha]BBN16426.1 hypothetical protein Mp_7g06180 [Marchantia polymorpha subsp. ruderalis]|eukprot:PTQ37416.1 hypothetical protein MARPO_0057s0053 [Marchantia polymorpha]
MRKCARYWTLVRESPPLEAVQVMGITSASIPTNRSTDFIECCSFSSSAVECTAADLSSVQLSSAQLPSKGKYRFMGRLGPIFSASGWAGLGWAWLCSDSLAIPCTFCEMEAMFHTTRRKMLNILSLGLRSFCSATSGSPAARQNSEVQRRSARLGKRTQSGDFGLSGILLACLINPPIAENTLLLHSVTSARKVKTIRFGIRCSHGLDLPFSLELDPLVQRNFRQVQLSTFAIGSRGCNCEISFSISYSLELLQHSLNWRVKLVENIDH